MYSGVYVGSYDKRDATTAIEIPRRDESSGYRVAEEVFLTCVK